MALPFNTIPTSILSIFFQTPERKKTEKKRRNKGEGQRKREERETSPVTKVLQLVSAEQQKQSDSVISGAAKQGGRSFLYRFHADWAQEINKRRAFFFLFGAVAGHWKLLCVSDQNAKARRPLLLIDYLIDSLVDFVHSQTLSFFFQSSRLLYSLLYSLSSWRRQLLEQTPASGFSLFPRPLLEIAPLERKERERRVSLVLNWFMTRYGCWSGQLFFFFRAKRVHSCSQGP